MKMGNEKPLSKGLEKTLKAIETMKDILITFDKNGDVIKITNIDHSQNNEE